MLNGASVVAILACAGPTLAQYISRLALAGIGTLAVSVPPALAEQWLGTVSTDWYDPANWDTGVPAGTFDVLVNNMLPNALVINGGAIDLDGRSIAIGTTANGAMTITGGASLTSGQSTITAEPQSTAVVTVTGNSSLWSTDNLVVGYEGQATLNIENSGVVTSNSVTIARNGGAGTVKVDGTGSRWDIGDIDTYIGHVGPGEVTISNGGVVTNAGRVHLGSGVGASGSVAIDGAGSRWEIGENLIIGLNGSGSLEITNGGYVAADIVTLGSHTSGSSASLILDGAGSELNADGGIQIGFSNSEALNITGGAGLYTGRIEENPFIGRSYVGYLQDRDQTTSVRISGAGSVWEDAYYIIAGNSYSDTTITVENGGAFRGVSLDVGRGRGIDPSNLANPFYQETHLLVSGTGTTVDFDWLAVGNAGAKATADISAGAVVTSGQTYLGGGFTRQGDVEALSDVDFILSGAGTLWTTTDTGEHSFLVDSGDTRISITDQARLDIAGDMELGGSYDDTPSQSVVDMTVAGAATVHTGGNALIGRAPESVATVIIDGAGSEWVVDGDLVVGAAGTGTLTIDGAGARLEVGQDLIVGQDGAGALSVTDGGHVKADIVTLGRHTDSSSATLNLDGAGSELVASGGISIGYAETPVMRITNGARLVTGEVGQTIQDGYSYIGRNQPRGGIATVVISGDGSEWLAHREIVMANESSASDAAILVEKGAALNGVSITIGQQRGIDTTDPAAPLFFKEARFVIRDAGSSATFGGVIIANSGAKAVVEVLGGATMTTGFTLLGGGNTSHLGIIAAADVDFRLSGAGTVWAATNTGGTSFSTDYGDYRIHVSNQALLDVDGDMELGYRDYEELDSHTQVTVADAGQVAVDGKASLGVVTGSSVGVEVDGAGSIWTSGGALVVGDAGSGTMVVTNEGAVLVNADTTVGKSAGGEGHIEITNSGAFSTDKFIMGISDGSASGFLTIDAATASANALTLNSGTLLVGDDGLLDLNGGAASIGARGLLTGTGTITGDASIAGRLAPGITDTLGTFNVTGNVTFQTGSTYAVRIAGTDPLPLGQTVDSLAVGGTADLTGGTVEIAAVDPRTSYVDGHRYATPIVSAAGGLGGTEFAGAGMTSGSAFITPTLSYEGNDVFLTIAVTQDFTKAAGTFNQVQAAGALNGLEQTGDALLVFNTIANMNEDDARRTVDLTSGEVHAAGQHVIDQTFALFSRTLRYQGVAGIGAGNVGAQTFTAPLGYGPAAVASSAGVVAIDDATTYADTRVRGAWAAPLGGFGHVDADGNAGKLDWWNAGLAGGYEGVLDVASGNAVAGFGFGYIHSRGTVDARLSTFDADGFYLGAYGGWANGPWNVVGSLSYGANRVSTERNVAFMGTTAEASYWTHTIGFSGEASYAFDLAGTTKLAPLFTLDAGWSGHGGFTETGAGALNLTSGSQSWSRLDTGLGLALTHTILTDSGKATLEGRAVWEHAFSDVVPSQNLALAGSPTSFTVLGPDAGRDRLRIGAGLSWDVSDDMTLRARYDGLFSGSQANHSASLGLNVRF